VHEPCESMATALAIRHTVARMVKSKEARVSALASCETSTMRYETHHDYSRSATLSQPASAARLAFLLPCDPAAHVAIGGFRLIPQRVDGCFARLLTLSTTHVFGPNKQRLAAIRVYQMKTDWKMNRNLGDSG
jgi:hypothetical protein